MFESSETCLSQEHNETFTAMLPELQSRAHAMSKRYSRSEDAAADALAAMYMNHTQAIKKNKRLNPSDLAWAAHHHLRTRSLVTRREYPSRNAPPVSLDDVEVTRQIGAALSTCERHSPFERCRLRVDWQQIMEKLPTRLQQIAYGLAIGRSKAEIAVELRISRCRVTQLLAQLAGEIEAYVVPEMA